MSEKILITAALLYANGPLHFGHFAGAYLPADCYARFQRLRGKDVLFISGSDEYGVAITFSAERAGRSPKEHVDLYHGINKELFERLDISFDWYSRTTNPYHKEPVQQFFLDLLQNEYIEKKTCDQLYNSKNNRFYADRYVVGTCPKCGYTEARGDECPSCGSSFDAIELKSPRCKVTGEPLTTKKTEHWFLQLEKFKERLASWLETKQWKSNVKNFIRGYIEDLHARSITRDSDWGLPIPLEDTQGKVLYVWFDAPIGYISITQEFAAHKNAPNLWKEYWLDPEVRLVQFIGKDNIPFHAAVFPAMCMGQNLPLKLVDELPANEFYNLEGRKFSKTDGWFIDIEDFLSRYSSDQLRWHIASTAPETQDSEFVWKEFQQKNNSELVGKFGNFVNRCLVFIERKFFGEIPEASEFSKEQQQFLDTIFSLAEEAASAFEQFSLRKACRAIMEIAQAGNVFFDAQKPWKMEEGSSELATTLYCCVKCIQTLALASSPILTKSAPLVWEMIGMKEPLEHFGWKKGISFSFEKGQKIKNRTILFEKIEDGQVEKEVQLLYSHTSNEKKTLEDS